MTDFATLKANGRGRTRGCPRCGEKNTGRVALQLQELDDVGKVKATLVHTSLSLCEPCSIAIFEAMLPPLKDARNGSGCRA